MANPLLTAEAARERRMAEQQKAAEMAERFPGWQVWSRCGAPVRETRG